MNSRAGEAQRNPPWRPLRLLCGGLRFAAPSLRLLLPDRRANERSVIRQFRHVDGGRRNAPRFSALRLMLILENVRANAICAGLHAF